MLLHNKILQEDAAAFSFDTCFSMDMKPYLKPVEFAPNEIILHTNEMPEHLLLLRRGLAKIYISQPNGRLSLTRFVHAPDLIGALELVGAQQTAEETRAVSTCRCLALPLTECRSLLLGDTIFLRCLCQFLGRQNIADSETYARNQTYPLENRLAAFMLLTAHDHLYTQRHMEAAEYLGVTYRHLLYVIAHFTAEGFLTKTPHGYAVTNEAALQQLAEV